MCGTRHGQTASAAGRQSQDTHRGGVARVIRHAWSSRASRSSSSRPHQPKQKRRPDAAAGRGFNIVRKAGEGVRTLNIQLGRLTLCQLSYARKVCPTNTARGRTRYQQRWRHSSHRGPAMPRHRHQKCQDAIDSSLAQFPRDRRRSRHIAGSNTARLDGSGTTHWFMRYELPQPIAPGS